MIVAPAATAEPVETTATPLMKVINSIPPTESPVVNATSPAPSAARRMDVPAAAKAAYIEAPTAPKALIATPIATKFTYLMALAGHVVFSPPLIFLLYYPGTYVTFNWQKVVKNESNQDGFHSNLNRM